MIEIDLDEELSMKEVDAVTEKINAQNEKILVEFEEYLKIAGLTPKTIKKHVDNIDFYINTYLLYYEIQSPNQGYDSLNDFFGNFFAHKAMWSSPATVKENITSLKKFYKYLNELSFVTDDELNEMNVMIKKEKENWVSLYDDVYDM